MALGRVRASGIFRILRSFVPNLAMRSGLSRTLGDQDRQAARRCSFSRGSAVARNRIRADFIESAREPLGHTDREDFHSSTMIEPPALMRRSGLPVNPSRTEVSVMGKGNNSQSKEKKKPKKGTKAAPVKAAPPPKKK